MPRKKGPRSRRPKEVQSKTGLESGPSARQKAPVNRGPRKSRKAGPPEVRLSTHKARCAWFRARSAWPVREAPVHALVRARMSAARGAQATMAEQWVGVGPTNIGGRITSVACDPKDANRVWVGAAGGGVWQTSDGGKSWCTNWHSQDILNIGSLALDPRNSDIIYCGTGEANLSADSYPGVGLYQSLDAGVTWHLLAGCSEASIPTRIGVLAVDPFDSSHLKLGGVGFREASASGVDMGGIYTSHDAGVTWTREEFVSSGNYWGHSIVFDPARSGLVYATVTEQGMKSGIWRSADGGVTWEHLANGLPNAASFGRTSLAMSPSDTRVLYAFAQSEDSGDSDLLLGVFRTSDGGDNWQDVSGNELHDEGQISYGNSIVVHPADPNTVLCGGVDLHVTRDGGVTWKRTTQWDADRGAAGYAHADHHALVMPPCASGVVYSGNDGGMDRSDDAGESWRNCSNGLAITMYYDLDVCRSDPRNYGGGAQDNGTLVTSTGNPGEHREILGGDGGWMVYDPDDPGHLYASFYNMGIYRFRGGQCDDVSPNVPENASVWMCYITMDPANPRTVYTGSTRVWRTLDDGDTWTPISPSLDDSAISALEVAPADSQRIYVGTENGGIFRSTDGGETWSANISSSLLPGHTITRLESSEKGGADLLYATVANFGHSHVFRSSDGGLSWEDIDKGQLPDVPHHAIVVVPDNPGTVYVGNDVGVFLSTDAGLTWSNMTLNLPNAMVVDLVYEPAGPALYAATYGRSLWKIKTAVADAAPTGPTGAETTGNAGADCQPAREPEAGLDSGGCLP